MVVSKVLLIYNLTMYLTNTTAANLYTEITWKFDEHTHPHAHTQSVKPRTVTQIHTLTQTHTFSRTHTFTQTHIFPNPYTYPNTQFYSNTLIHMNPHTSQTPNTQNTLPYTHSNHT